MDRRTFVGMGIAGSIAMASGFSRSESSASGSSAVVNPENTDELYPRWQKLDTTIRGWWDGDLHRADEEAIRKDSEKTLLFLPHPYCSAGGSEAAFPEMYGWDTQFMNLALLAHGRTDIVKDHILNHLFMIDRYGMVLNGNRTYYLTRSQPPLWAWSVENYLAVKKDEDLALHAYASLQREYNHYWNAPPHLTPTGLATCYDTGDPGMTPQLASECEAGLDFTPIFDGDIRHCVPIHMNACLVRYARVLGSLAGQLGLPDRVADWKKQADERARRINEFCWNEKEGFYFEYDFIRKKQLPFYSLNPYWLLWTGVASKEQAARVASQIARFEHPSGLTFTDKDYPSPHPAYKVNEWAYPEAWPPQQIIVAQGLELYGFREEARRITRSYLGNLVDTYEKTGLTWERYNAVAGGHDCPVERTPSAPLHGWSSASAVVLGQLVFG
jgi:alpha,alpha-trehalase